MSQFRHPRPSPHTLLKLLRIEEEKSEFFRSKGPILLQSQKRCPREISSSGSILEKKIWYAETFDFCSRAQTLIYLHWNNYALGQESGSKLLRNLFRNLFRNLLRLSVLLNYSKSAPHTPILLRNNITHFRQGLGSTQAYSGPTGSTLSSTSGLLAYPTSPQPTYPNSSPVQYNYYEPLPGR